MQNYVLSLNPAIMINKEIVSVLFQNYLSYLSLEFFSAMSKAKETLDIIKNAAMVVKVLKRFDRATPLQMKQYIYKNYGIKSTNLLKHFSQALNWCAKFDVVKQQKGDVFLVQDKNLPRNWLKIAREAMKNSQDSSDAVSKPSASEKKT